MATNNNTEEKGDMVDEFIDPLIDKAVAYGKTNLELLKLRAVQRASIMAPAVINRVIIIILSGLFLLVLNIGVAIWVGELLGKMYYGFFVVAGFYGLVTLIYYLFIRKSVNRSVGEWIISELL